MPVTVCDSSPLIHLAGVGHLDLLPRFYGTVLIPPAVFREVVTEGGTRSPARMVAQAGVRGLDSSCVGGTARGCEPATERQAARR